MLWPTTQRIENHWTGGPGKNTTPLRPGAAEKCVWPGRQEIPHWIAEQTMLSGCAQEPQTRHDCR